MTTPATGHRQNTEHRLLRLQDLRRLRHLSFSSKRVVEGHYAGRHASPQRGHSVEFSDYREYSPGDELADIDWKVYGRSDRFFIKLFEHQSDMVVNLLIDASASMRYAAGGRDSKYDHACRMAAAIAFLTIRQQDRVGLAIAQDGLLRYEPALGSFKQLNHVLHTLDSIQPAGEAKLAQALHDAARRIGRRGVNIIFSDLLEETQPIMQAIGMLTQRGSEVIVFHVMDADELQLPDLADAVFEDSESGQKLRLNVDDVRSHYAVQLDAFLKRWRGAMKARGIDYNLVSTAVPYHQSLEAYMFSRTSIA